MFLIVEPLNLVVPEGSAIDISPEIRAPSPLSNIKT